MRILFVSPTGAFFSGAEVAIVNLMTFLAQKGHQIYNVIPDNDTNRDERYLSTMAEAGIRVYELPSMSWWWQESSEIKPLDQNAITAYQLNQISEIRNIIHKENINLVISNTVNVFQGMLAAACEKIPHYMIIHEFPYGEFGYYKEKVDLISQLSAKIFAVDGELYSELKQHFPNEKLYPFIPYTDLESKKLLPEKRHRIVSIGGITERKNQLELIEAYSHLGKYDIELVFIGSWDEVYKRKCDDFITSHKLNGISFLGFKNDPWSLITEGDIIVFSSKMEAFPLVFVESILSGTPSIVSDNLGHLSVNKVFETGKIYQLGNFFALSQAIESVLEDFENYKIEAEKTQLRARKLYTLERTSQIFLDQLAEINQVNRPTIFSELESLFKLKMGIEMLETLKWDKVTIFYADEWSNYSIENSETRALKKNDYFKIKVGNSPKIRIDLSELPGAFTNLKLISQKTNTVLEPIFSNAVVTAETILFFEKDPQLIYDTRYYQQDTLLFTYERLEIPALSLGLKTILDSQGQELEKLSQKLQVEQLRYQNLEQVYDRLKTEHQMIITSRRWTMMNKILHFLRRK